MHAKLKQILLFSFFFIATGAFAQSKKLVKSFKLGVVAYALYESYKPSQSNNDTAFYLLYRVGKIKMVAKEIKAIREKSEGDTLTFATYKINKNAIVFYRNTTNAEFYHRIYTQQKNGLLGFKSNLIPPVRIEPFYDKGRIEPKYDDTADPSAVDIMPEFPGGMTALRKYISNNLEYPEDAQENEVSGTVNAKFVITKDGSVANIEIERKLGYGCDEEVIRILKRMPKWRPGRLKGKAVDYLYRLPIRFAMQ